MEELFKADVAGIFDSVVIDKGDRLVARQFADLNRRIVLSDHSRPQLARF